MQDPGRFKQNSQTRAKKFHPTTGLGWIAIPRLWVCCRQVEIEMVSNNSNTKIQTWEQQFSRALYVLTCHFCVLSTLSTSAWAQCRPLQTVTYQLSLLLKVTFWSIILRCNPRVMDCNCVECHVPCVRICYMQSSSISTQQNVLSKYLLVEDCHRDWHLQ